MNDNKDKKKNEYGSINKFFDLPIVKTLIAPILVMVIGTAILAYFHLTSGSSSAPVWDSSPYPEEAFITIGGIRIMDEHIFYFGVALIVISLMFGIVSWFVIRAKTRKLELTLTEEYGPEYVVPMVSTIQSENKR